MKMITQGPWPYGADILVVGYTQKPAQSFRQQPDYAESSDAQQLPYRKTRRVINTPGGHRMVRRSERNKLQKRFSQDSLAS